MSYDLCTECGHIPHEGEQCDQGVSDGGRCPCIEYRPTGGETEVPPRKVLCCFCEGEVPPIIASKPWPSCPLCKESFRHALYDPEWNRVLLY